MAGINLRGKGLSGDLASLVPVLALVSKSLTSCDFSDNGDLTGTLPFFPLNRLRSVLRDAACFGGPVSALANGQFLTTRAGEIPDVVYNLLVDGNAFLRRTGNLKLPSSLDGPRLEDFVAKKLGKEMRCTLRMTLFCAFVSFHRSFNNIIYVFGCVQLILQRLPEQAK